MATTHANDEIDDTSLSCPSPTPCLGNRPIMSSDVTADDHPEQPLRFKAARDRFDGNYSNVILTNFYNATLVAEKSVCLDTPDLGRTAQWVTDNINNQSTAKTLFFGKLVSNSICVPKFNLKFLDSTVAEIRRGSQIFWMLS